MSDTKKQYDHNTFFARYALLILAGFALVTPFVLYGAFRAVRSNTNRVEDWLPKTYTETSELAWFRTHFVADQFIVISWDGCLLGDDPTIPGGKPDDPRIERLVSTLTGKTGNGNVALDPSQSSLDEGVRFPVCSPDPLAALFREAGLGDVAVAALDIATTFASFDDYWQPFLGGQGPAPAYVMSLDEAARGRLRDRLRERLPVEPDGSIDLVARAWAVRGRVP